MDAQMQAELDRVSAAMEVKQGKDTRAAVCACGHPIGKHKEQMGRLLCNALQVTCPCRETREVARTPNARIFCFKTDDAGPALIKGWIKAVGMELGDRVEWTATCVDCNETPVTVVAIDGGKTNEPRCGVHR